MKEKDFKGLKVRGFDLSQAMQNPTLEHSSGLVFSINLGSKCYYHSGMEAFANCGHCGESVCSECSTIYRGDILLGIPDEELCFQCKANKTRKDRTFDLFTYGLIVVGFILSMTGAFLIFLSKVRSA